MPTRSSFGESSLPVRERPAEFQPTLIQTPLPIVKTVGSPGTHALDRDQLVAVAGREVVVVRDEHVAVGGRGRHGDQVAASAVDRGPPPRSARRVPDLLDRAREQRQRVHVGAGRGAVELLEHPRHRVRRDLPISLGERELFGSRPTRGEIVVERDRALQDVGARLADLLADLAVRALEPEERDRVRRHRLLGSSERSSRGRRGNRRRRCGGAPTTAAAAGASRPAVRAASTSAPRPHTVAASHARPRDDRDQREPAQDPEAGQERQQPMGRGRDQASPQRVGPGRVPEPVDEPERQEQPEPERDADQDPDRHERGDRQADQHQGPEPDRGAEPFARGPRRGVGRPGTNRISSSPRRNDETEVASQTRIRLTTVN